MGESTSVMVNSPSRLAANLGFGRDRLRFYPSTHTFAPFLEGWKFCQVRLFIVCLARSWVAKASFLIARRECRWSWTAGREVSEMMVGSTRGSYPIMRKNGDWLVTEEGSDCG